MQVVLDSLDLAQAERKLCAHALRQAGTIIEAASLLGITRHALKRRITKHRIAWPPPETPESLRAQASMQSGHEFQSRVPAAPVHQQEPRMNRPNMRPNNTHPMNQGMHTPQPAAMPSHSYDHRSPMDNTRVRPAPPAHSMPNMMQRPDLRKYDR